MPRGGAIARSAHLGTGSAHLGTGSTPVGAAAEAEVEVDEMMKKTTTGISGSDVVMTNLFSMPESQAEAHQETSAKMWDLRCLNAFMIVITLASILQLGFELDYPEWRTTWLILQHFFTAAFVLELVIKLSVLKGKYFSDKANCVDGLIAVLGALEVWVIEPTGGDSALRTALAFRACRYLRLVKILRLMRIRTLSVVLGSVAKATKASTTVFIVLTIIIYVFALFLTQSLGKEDTGLYPGFSSDVESPVWQEMIGPYNPYMYFGSVPASMYTLFNMASFTEWQEIVRPIAVKEPAYLVVFLLFALVVGFGFMNVLVAVIVDTVFIESVKMDEEQRAQAREEKVKALERIQEMLAGMDANRDGTIDWQELNQLMNQSTEMKALLKNIDFPRGWSSSEMLGMLDSNGQGLVDVATFSKSLFRLIYGGDFQQMCIMQVSINKVKAMLVHQNKSCRQMFDILQADLAAVKAAVETAGVRQASQSQPQAFTGATSDTGHQSNIENDLISRMQMTVKECIRQEFVLWKPGRSNSFPGVVSSGERDGGALPWVQRAPQAERHAIAAGSEARQLQAQQLQSDLQECKQQMEDALEQFLIRIEEDAKSAVQEPVSAVPPREDQAVQAPTPREDLALSPVERAKGPLRARGEDATLSPRERAKVAPDFGQLFRREEAMLNPRERASSALRARGEMYRQRKNAGQTKPQEFAI